MAARAGPRLPRRVQDARPNLAAGRIGRPFRGNRIAEHSGAEVDRKWRMDLLDAYLLHAERRSPRLPGQGGDPQRAVEPLCPGRGRLHRRGRGAVLGQLAIADEPVHPHQQLPAADHAGRPRSGDLHPLGRRAVPAGQPAVEGLRPAELASLEASGLERHVPGAQGKVFRARISSRHGRAAAKNWRRSRPACWNW